MNKSSSVRTVAVGVHDWAVHAAAQAGLADVLAPVAVVHHHRVHARSRSAAVAGVQRHDRRRDAETKCPGLIVVDHDPGRDAMFFEAVVAAMEELAAGVEVIRPGLLAAAAKGPAGWHGGEENTGEAIVDHLAAECGVEAVVGIADGVWAATIAASRGLIVPPGNTPAFLAGLGVGLLSQPEFVDLLQGLGIVTLGELAALPAGDVGARFGPEGIYAHRLASGRDDHPLAPRNPPVDLAVDEEYDEPIDRVDRAAFAAKILATRLHDRLTGRSLACTRVRIEATTAGGEYLERTWRHEGRLTAEDLSNRVRWQLEGWLTNRAITGSGPTAGIAQLRLVPDGLISVGALQQGLWGTDDEGHARAHRGAIRLQGLFGPDAVVTIALSGGLSPADQVQQVPWGEEKVPAQPVDRPWPGRIEGRPPTLVPGEPIPVALLDASGHPVTVDGRVTISARPAILVWDGIRHTVTGWAGPWPADEQWDAPQARRVVRCQLVLSGSRAVLVQLRDRTWRIEAIYE